MAGVNKNSSRGSAVRGGGKGHQFSSDVRLIQSLGGGRFARVADPNGRSNHHVQTESDAFVEALAALAQAGMADRLGKELNDLASGSPEWSQARERVRGSGVLNVEAGGE